MKIEITKEELKVLLYGLDALADNALSMNEMNEYTKLQDELIARFFSRPEYEV
jgi:hypothetical protein